LFLPRRGAASVNQLMKFLSSFCFSCQHAPSRRGRRKSQGTVAGQHSCRCECEARVLKSNILALLVIYVLPHITSHGESAQGCQLTRGMLCSASRGHQLLADALARLPLCQLGAKKFIFGIQGCAPAQRCRLPVGTPSPAQRSWRENVLATCKLKLFEGWSKV